MSAWTVIQHIEVPSAQATISFTNIPQTYTDLVVKISGRSSGGGGNSFDGIRVKPNGSASDLTTRLLYGLGSGTPASATDVNVSGGETSNSNATANTFGNSEIYFPNYAGSTNKSFSSDGVSENNATQAVQVIAANLWSQTTAITSLDFTLESAGNWAQYSSATLYGVLKGSSGGVTVS
jgi:hypothetical protein